MADQKGSLVNIAVAAGQHHCIQRCDFSYDGAIAVAGELTIGLAATVISVATNEITVANATGFAAEDVPLLIDVDAAAGHIQNTTGKKITAVNETTNVLTFEAGHTLVAGDVIIKVEYMLYVTGGGPGPLIGNDTPLFIGNKGAGVGIWLKEIAETKSRLNVLYY